MIKNENYVVIQGWMRNELQLKGNDLIVYAIIYNFSQDGESKFDGSLQYLADWCGATKQGIQKNLKKLLEAGLIKKETKKSSRGNLVSYYTTKFHTYTTKFHGGIQLSCPNNIQDNKEDNKKDISIINNTNNKKSLVKKSKKSLYEKMQDEIYLFTKNIKLQNALRQFLDLQLEIYREQGKTYYSNIFKSKLNKLKSDFDEEDWLKTVQYATEKGWQNFYPIKDYDKTSKRRTRKCDEGLSCEQYTDEEWEENKKWQKEQIAKGEQITF